MGLCLLVLPLCGGAGIAQAPPLAVWMVVMGLASWRSTLASQRFAARTMLAMGIGGLVLLGAYFVDFHFPNGHEHSPDLGRTLQVALQSAALAFGPAAQTHWLVSGWAIGLLVLATLGLLATTIRRNPGERLRASGLLACLAGTLLLALSIGYGRGGEVEDVGYATRYVTLTAPLLAAVHFAWLLFGSVAARRWLPVLLFLLVAGSLHANIQSGIEFGRRHAEISRRLDEDVRAGASIPEIASRLGSNLYPNQDGGVARLEALHRAGPPPFRGRPYAANAAPPDPRFATFKPPPERIVSPRGILFRKVGTTRVLLAHPECELWFRIPPGAKKLTGQFGILPDVVRRGRSDGVRFTVERIAGEETPLMLFDRFLDPKTRTEDRGFQSLSVELPGDGSGSLVLRTSNPPGKNDDWDWAYWSEIEIQ